MMAGVDRISVLPEEIKVSILSRLDITDAVRTSALSRSWRHLWTLLPGFWAELDLTEAPNHSKGIFRSPEIVDHLLSFLRGPIHHFSLECSPGNQSPHIQNFLDLIFQKDGLQMLSVFWHGPLLHLQLPYFCLLKELDLYRIDLCLPSEFCGFDHLTILKLHDVRISQQDIQLLIDRSKKLTSVDCAYLIPADAKSGGSLSVTFSCPLLKEIRFHFWEFITEVRVVSAPCLKRAYVTASNDIPDLSIRVAGATRRFMADITQVSYLSLRSDVLECLSRVDVPHTSWVHFHQLRHLKLHGHMFSIDRRMHKMFCCLLRSMPSLESLELQGYGHHEGYERLNELDPIPPNEYTKKKYDFRCLDRTLRRVIILMYKLDDNDIMWILRFMLLNANVLELITISCLRDDPEVKSRILGKLCEVEKASVNAQVMFVDICTMNRMLAKERI